MIMGEVDMWGMRNVAARAMAILNMLNVSTQSLVEECDLGRVRCRTYL